MTPRRLAAFGTAMVALTIGAAPILTSAADHLDAPALAGTVVNGQIAPHSEHGDRDINDVYVFKAPDNANRTVLVMTVNPAINLFGGSFGTNVRYTLNIDKNGDNKADVIYVTRFGGERTASRASSSRSTPAGKRPHLVPERLDRRMGQAGNASTKDGPEALGRRPFGPVLLRPDRVHRHDHEAQDRHRRRRRRPGRPPDRLLRQPQHERHRAVDPELAAPTPSASGPRRASGWTATGARPTRWVGRRSTRSSTGRAPTRTCSTRPRPRTRSAPGRGSSATNVMNGLKFFSSLDTEGAYSDAQAGPGGRPDPRRPDLLPQELVAGSAQRSSAGRRRDRCRAQRHHRWRSAWPVQSIRDATGAVPSDGVGPHTDYQLVVPLPRQAALPPSPARATRSGRPRIRPSTAGTPARWPRITDPTRRSTARPRHPPGPAPSASSPPPCSSPWARTVSARSGPAGSHAAGPGPPPPEGAPSREPRAARGSGRGRRPRWRDPTDASLAQLDHNIGLWTGTSRRIRTTT